MEYPDEITIEGEDLQFWKRYSGIIFDLANEDTELTMERDFFNIINPSSELVDENVYPPESSELYWSMFVDLVQGNRVGGFGKDDLLYLDPRKGYTKKRLIRLLDYIDFPTNQQSLEALKQYVFNHQMNSVQQPTVPRGIGIHKTPKSYKPKKYNRYYNNFNNNGVNDYENYIKAQENSNDEENNLDYDDYQNENANLKRLLDLVSKPPLPYSKTAKQRKLKRRHHTRMTKKMKPKNLRKPKKNRRNSKTAKKYVKNNNNTMNEAINYFQNNNNNDTNSTFSFDD